MMIREMTPMDADAAAFIEKETFSQPWSRQAFLDSLANPNTMFLTAEEECGGNDDAPVVIGYVGMYLAGDEGEITNVAVTPDFRRKGIGKALISELIARAEERGVSRIVLEVRVSNHPAIALYEQMGFCRVGTRRGFYDFPKEDADIMIRDNSGI
jgi:ribosomal-protein-alanine N-acetyltransferase